MLCFQGSNKTCRLKTIKMEDFPKNANRRSLLTLEYGAHLNPCKLCGYRINRLPFRKSRSFVNSTLTDYKQNLEKRKFSKFIQVTAEQIKKELMNRTNINTKISSRPKKNYTFTVIHLRGMDRPCAAKNLKVSELLEKIKSFRVSRWSDIVYVMTNMPDKNPFLRGLRYHFRNSFLFEKSDIAVFESTTFQKLGTYLIYAVELELQNLADKIVLTYPGHSLSNIENIRGILAPDFCSASE